MKFTRSVCSFLPIFCLGLFYLESVYSQEGATCAVVLFDIDEDGLPVQRGSYPTNSSGGYSLVIDAEGRWLFASNSRSNDIAVYSIESDGSLTLAEGSPFSIDAMPLGMARHPSLGILYMSVGSAVSVFAIQDDGSPSKVQSVDVSEPRDLEVEPGGRFLYVANMSSKDAVRGYAISESGLLSELSDSPYRFDSSRAYEIEISSDGKRLFVLDLDQGIAVFDIGDSGGLTLVEGSPRDVGGYAHPLVVTDDERYAYVGFPLDSHMGMFEIGPGGLPEALPGSPIPAEPRVQELIAPPGTSRLYAITRTGIHSFAIAGDGSLVTLGDPVPVDLPGGVVRGAVFIREESIPNLSGRIYCLVAPLEAHCPRTITVGPGGSGRFSEIQDAINEASEGDTVLVKPGEYLIAEPIEIRGITVKSENGPEETVIRMSHQPAHSYSASVVVFMGRQDTVLDGFTLLGGKGSFKWYDEQYRGEGIYCYESSPTLMNCVISGNSGWGVYCKYSSPLFVNCTVSGNAGGGVFCWDSSPILRNCILWDNAEGSFWLDENSNPEAEYSCIEDDAPWPGDGNINSNPLFCGWGSAGEVHVDLSSPGPGTGTETSPYSEVLTALEYNLDLSGSSPCRGTGRDGKNMGAGQVACEGAGEPERLIHLGPGTYTTNGLNLIHRASLQGAGEAETILGGTLLGLRTGTFLSHLTVTAGSQGGIVVRSSEAPEILNCTIIGNTKDIYPGGVHCINSSPVLTNCTIKENSGSGVTCRGSSPILTNCTISGNWTWWGPGGGVYCDPDSSPVLTNCELIANSAGNGGGIFCDAGSSPTLTNCTITANWAFHGGGAYCNSGSSPIFKNSIFWDNPDDDGGRLVLSDTVKMSHCSLNNNPLFVQPGHWDENGTPDNPADDLWIEGDYQLQPGSPCIDAGMLEGSPTFDIEGNGRPCGTGVDLGAHESGPCDPPSDQFRRGDVDGNGALEVTDVIKALDFQFVGGEVLDCLDAADTDDNGELELTDAIRSLNYQFLGTASAPEPPGPYRCGIDPTIDGLTCESPPACLEPSSI